MMLNNNTASAELPLAATVPGPSGEGVEIQTPDQTAACESCGSRFERRKGSGGKPQRFCSPECRQAFHASEKPNVSQCGQRATLGTPPAVIPTPAPKTPAPATSWQDFDWGTDDAVVLADQPGIAVYRNERADLVIRQERAWDQEEDLFILVRVENIAAFIDKLTDIAGVPSAGK